MEKLVLTFGSGDGCTFSCDNNLPFWAESKIAAELELLEMWQEWEKKISNPVVYGQQTSYLKFHGHELDFWDFVSYDDKSKTNSYVEPEILTLDEWFGRYCEEKLVDAIQN
jgi:hypothetical protein